MEELNRLLDKGLKPSSNTNKIRTAILAEVEKEIKAFAIKQLEGLKAENLPTSADVDFAKGYARVDLNAKIDQELSKDKGEKE